MEQKIDAKDTQKDKEIIDRVLVFLSGFATGAFAIVFIVIYSQ